MLSGRARFLVNKNITRPINADILLRYTSQISGKAGPKNKFCVTAEQGAMCKKSISRFQS